MKILIIENNLAGGGAEKVLLTLLNNLSPTEYEITLLLIKNKGIYIKDIPSHVDLKFMIDDKKNSSSFPLDRNILSGYLEKMVGNQYDVEIAFLEGPPTRLLAYSSNPDSRKIAWVHIDMEKVHWTYSYYDSLYEERECYLKMDQIVFVSESAKRGFENLFQQKFPNTIIINNPIDTEFIKSLSTKRSLDFEDFTCVIVGSLVNRKGHSRLIYSMGRLIQMGYFFHLYIIGEGSEETSLKELCHILGISEYVHFVGFQRNPYPYIANADLLISSSISEGYPLVLCEALALGTPILATNCSGNIDVLENGKYGLLVENSEYGLFTGLKEVLSRPLKYHELQNKAALGLNKKQFKSRLRQIERIIEGNANV